MGRITKAKETRREALREELQAREYLRQLDMVDTEITNGWKEMTSEQVAALRLKVDVNCKRLAKVLPDIKSVELSDPDGGPLQINVVSFADLPAKQLDT